jgi:hypothetical protein
MIRVTTLAGDSTSDDRPGSSVTRRLGSDGDLQHYLRGFGLNYEESDYLRTRPVVIVIDADVEDPRDQEIDRLRRALIASGVKEGLVDAIQKGGE